MIIQKTVTFGHRLLSSAALMLALAAILLAGLASALAEGAQPALGRSEGPAAPLPFQFTAGNTGSAGSALVDKVSSLPPLPSVAVPTQSPGLTSRVSVASAGTQGNDESYAPAISADGRFVAFDSQATNLVPGGDANGWMMDVFVHDWQMGQTSLVSVSSGGTQGNGHSTFPAISAEGRFVAFQSDATNLVAGDTNDARDVFVRDRQTGRTSRVSIASGGAQGNGQSRVGPISPDGRFVVFTSAATNLVPGDTNGHEDAFIHDRQTGQTSLVSIATDGALGNDGSLAVAVSADGRLVAFESWASNLVPGDIDDELDVFVRDRQTGQTSCVSVATGGTMAGGRSGDAVMSGDGRVVAFWSWATSLVPGDTNDEPDIFVHDRQTGQTSRVSVASGGAQGNGGSEEPAISADGRFVAFDSWATNLVSGDTNDRTDVFVHDRQTGRTSRVSVASDGTQGNGISEAADISSNGRFVAFDSTATNLVPGGDANDGYDVFIHALGPLAVDLGLRPAPDGYQFGNYGGVNYADYTLQDMQRQFGDECVCHMSSGICAQHRLTAIDENTNWNRSMNGGHCYGMAVSSLRFFKDLEDPAVFQAGARATHDLAIENARRLIAYYHVEQFFDPASSAISIDRARPSVVLYQLYTAMMGGAPDPMVLAFLGAGGGHAVTPYAITDQGSGVYWIEVYDNNWPNDDNRHLVVDSSNDTWSYDLGGGLGTWTGDARTRSLLIVSLSDNPPKAPCPWVTTNVSLGASALPSSQVWLQGQGHLLITDSQGLRIGYVGDQFVNEIPGAYERVMLGGLGQLLEPIYHLPLDTPYTVLLDGQTLTEDGLVDVIQSSPGHVVSVEGILLKRGSRERLVLASDGSQVAYQADASQEINIEMIVETADQSHRFRFTGADVRLDQTISVAASGDSGMVTFSNKEAGDGRYSFEFRQASASGTQRFAHDNIEISRKDTHHLDYGKWDGSGQMKLYVDVGSNSINYVPIDLENQASSQGVEVRPATQTRLGVPGGTVTFVLEVSNTGEAPDSYDVMLSGNAWPAEVADTIGPVEAGGNARLNVQVQVPPATTAGMTDSANITVASQADDTQRASAQIRTGIRSGALFLPFITR